MVDFLKELTRRKVWLFGGIYLALGWVLLQVAVVIETTLSLPTWVDQIALVLLTLGFPVALLLAWAQESGAEKGALGEGQNWSEFSEGSVAILPFRDLTGSENGARQAALIAANLSARLSHRSGFHILAGGATERFASLQVDPREVSRDLKVRYLLTGTIDGVETSGASDVVFTIQLQNGQSGEQFWSKTYEGSLADKEMVPSEKMARLVASLDWIILGADADSQKGAVESAVSAGTITYRAWAQISQGSFIENWAEARRMLNRALDIDPDHPRALALRAKAIGSKKTIAFEDVSVDDHELMMRDVQKAVRLAPNDPWVLSMAASIFGFERQFDKAAGYTDIALDLDPDNPLALTMKCENAFMAGNFDEFQSTFGRMLEKHPNDPVGYVWYTFGAEYEHYLGNLEKALAFTHRARDINPNNFMWKMLAVPILVDMGREDEARALLPQLKNIAQFRSREAMFRSRLYRAEQLAGHDERVSQIWERLGVFDEEWSQ